MRTSPLAIVLFALSIAACGSDPDSSTPEADPASPELLKKADTISLGCSYVEHETFYADGTARPTETPKCEDVPCDAVRDYESDTMSIGGSVIGSSKFAMNKEEFVGTCSDRTPIKCDEDAGGDPCAQCAAKSCCRSTFLCDHDPNCGAIIDCIVACDQDDACVDRCMINGDWRAAENLRAAFTCLTAFCADSCKN